MAVDATQGGPHVRPVDGVVRFGVLGPLEVRRGEARIELGAPKQRQVLGVLLVNAGAVVSTDRLIDDIWGPERGPDRQNALWVHISNLRKVLRADGAEGSKEEFEPLVTRSPGYTLDLDRCALDATEFERLVVEGRALIDTDPNAASMVFAEALALWRGRAYEDFSYEPWAQTEIARLEELRLEAVESRVDADLRRGRGRELVGELDALVREHPTRERLTGALMVALYRSGRAADALRAYQGLCTRVGDELGIEPSPRLRRLHDRIVTSDPDLEPGRGRPSSGSGDTDTGPSVRGYEIRDRLGERGSGVLYRAFQPAIGREVVVKVIRPELADDPTFIRRFEAEAQLIAHLEHPHIVPLYDYWREPGAAYLVMRSVRGGTLGDLIARGPVGRDLLAAIVDQVGSALETAHRDGVTHGDVSPYNVLIDDSGNAYLADFEPPTALRHTTTTARTARAGASSANRSRSETPAPTIRTGVSGADAGAGDEGGTGSADRTVAVAADVRAFARTVAVAAAGRHGAMTDLVVGLDGNLAGVLQRGTDGAHGAFDDVCSFRQAVSEALHTTTPTAAPAVVENPYKGLRSFAAGDAADFFGRERFIERLVVRLSRAGRAGRFVAVVGPSGSGKSSAVRAGLLPALRSGAAPGSEDWFLIEMVPGRHPFEQLETALLRVAVHPPASLLEHLSGTDGLRRAADRVLPEDDATLVVVVDQFEELFTQSTPEEAERFVAALCQAVDDEHGRIRIVATLRADFYDRPLRHRALGELIRHGTEVLTPMSTEELERAIAGPAERVGVQCEPALVAELVAAVVDRPSALPLLQYTLTELFERRTGTTLTVAAYRDIGGVSGALADRAEALFAGLEADEQEAAREIFLRLVTLGEGAADTRRRVLLTELASIDGVAAHARQVTDTFGRHRLLGFDRDPLTRSPTVEIAHEALLTEWQRLRRWIEDARSDVRAERRLAEATEEWEVNDRSDSFLLAGGRLTRYDGWAEDPPVGLTTAERDLLRASEASEHERADAAAEQARRDAQLRRRSKLLASLAVIVVAVVALATFAIIQQQRASDLADELSILGDARRIASAAQVELKADPEVGTMLAIEAARVAAEDGEVPPEVMDALHAGIQANRTVYPVADDVGVAVRAGAGGGVFLMPPDDLIALAQTTITRPLDPDECDAADLDSCGDPRDPVPTGLVVEGGDDAYRGTQEPGRPLAGATVSMLSVWGEASGWQLALRADFDEFTERTGIAVDVNAPPINAEGAGNDFLLSLETDLAWAPQPGRVLEVGPDHWIDLSVYLDRDEIEQAYGEHLTSLLSVGDDGSWPASSGGLYGLWASLDDKSLIWTSSPGLAADPPTSWDELLALSDRLVADGETPWCLGIASGLASGWPATDLIEALLVRAAGPQVYDAWWRHEVPFDHPEVVAAARRANEVIFSDGYLDGTPTGASQTDFSENTIGLVADPPACTMTPGASFNLEYVPADERERLWAIPFPSVDPLYADATTGAGRYIHATTDRPEVREVMRYIASPEFGQASVDAQIGGYIPAHREFDLTTITDPRERAIAEATHRALAADQFRFDASDLMPQDVGGGPFWDGMIRWFQEGPDSIEGILGELEQTWQEHEADADP